MLILFLLLSYVNIFAQSGNGGGIGSTANDTILPRLRTTVYRLNLDIPRYNSFEVISGPSHSSLVVHNKRNLALILSNGNPYRYNYKINHSYLSLFKDEKNPFDTIGKVIKQARAATAPAAGISAVTAKARGNEISDNIIATFGVEAAYIGIMPMAVAASDDDLYDKNLISLKILIEAEHQLRSELEFYISEISSEEHLDKHAFQENRILYLQRQVQIRTNYMDLYSAIAIALPNKIDEFKDRTKLLDEISKTVDAEINKMFTLKLDNYMIPINFDGENIDAIDVTLERQEKQVSNAPANITKYRVWVIGGLKIDVSPGVFFTTVKDMEYGTEEGTTAGKKIIYEKDKGNLQLAVGSTVNVAFRSSGWVRPTFCAGALLTQDQNIQIIAGGGFHFGKMERVSLLGGISMGMQKEINSRYKANASTEYDLGTSTDLPTNDVFKIGGFFGITYNLGKVNKAEPKIAQ